MSAAAAPAKAEPAAASPALDHRLMQLALALGRRGLGRTWPNPAVGAVIVKDGVILGRGWTQTRRPTARRDRGAQARRQGCQGRDALCHARAVLASGQDAALRPMPSSAPASPALCRRWKTPIRKWPGKAIAGSASMASRSRRVCAEMRRRASTRDTSAGCARAGRRCC